MPRCPSCFVPLTRVEEGTLKWFTCQSCFGTWINNLMLTRMIRAGTPVDGASLTDLAETVTASNTTEVLRCPQCEKQMMKDKFHPMIPVGIDRCKPCGFVWLDAGELALLRQLYHELMTSDDPEIVRRREKVGAMLAQWDARHGHTNDNPRGLGGDLGTAVDVGFDVLGFFLRSL